MKYFLMIVGMILLVTQSFADPTKGITYITEEFPPYNFKSPDGKIVGINADVLVEMFKKMGSNKTQANIKMRPWKRGYGLVQIKGKKNVLFSTTRTAAREKLFKWVGPLSEATNALITLKGNPSNVQVKNKNDFKKYKNQRYGAIKNDMGEFTLIENGVPLNNINTSSTFKQMYKKLKTKRIGVMSYSGQVALFLIKKNGGNPADYEIIYQQPTGQHYFAFNLSVDDGVVKSHQDALDQVKGDKTLMKSIKAKYLK